MSNNYLSIGIDHGTTNSSIAVMEHHGPRVIKVNVVDEIMPSAVYINARGRTSVGRPAYQAMMTNKPEEGEGYTGYKLRIGQGDRYEFPNGKFMTAPQLGGMVIGELLKAYQEDSGVAPNSAVITMPAKFEDSACEGTREAARAAGLKFFPLLQEPVAAAMAYGFTSTDKSGQWMIFDLGGGTLDISLLVVREGRMVVPEEGHTGDNRLGGRKFDRELMDFALGELRKQYALEGFTESNRSFRQAWGVLSIACEQAKIQLSTRADAVIQVDNVLCRDERGKEVKVEIPIARARYEKMIAADVDKAIHLAKTLLATNRLQARDLTRIILVGGPTKTPSIQRALSEGLGLEISPSVDPMTAVALGAAIHATTVELPEELRPSVQGAELGGAVRLTLKFERTPKTPVCAVFGAIESPGMRPNTLQVQIRRSDGWSTGRLPVGEDGLFEAEAKLLDEGRPQCSLFTTEVLDPSGKILATTQELQVWYPIAEGNARLANSLLIAVQGNRTTELVRKGVELPAKGRQPFETLTAIRRGSKEDCLQINVLEGVTDLFGNENERADLSAHVAKLLIPGDQLEGDLPQGAEIQVTLIQDASRHTECIAYIPLLEQEFTGLKVREQFDVSVEKIVETFEPLKKSLEDAERLQKEIPTASLNEKFEIIRRLNVLNEIDKEIERAKQGERDAFHRSYKRILELAGAMQHIREAQIGARIRSQIRQLKKVVDPNDERMLREIETDFESTIKGGDKANLERIEAAVAELDGKVRRRPYNDVLIDICALDGMKVTSKQNEVYKKAGELLNRIDQKGGVSAMTDSDLADLTAAHRAFAENYPELGEQRKKFLDGLPAGRGNDDLGKHLRRAGSHSS